MRYYDRRAPEYEEIYYRNDPVRLGELDRAPGRSMAQAVLTLTGVRGGA